MLVHPNGSPMAMLAMVATIGSTNAMMKVNEGVLVQSNEGPENLISKGCPHCMQRLNGLSSSFMKPQ